MLIMVRRTELFLGVLVTSSAPYNLHQSKLNQQLQIDREAVSVPSLVYQHPRKHDNLIAVELINILLYI